MCFPLFYGRGDQVIHNNASILVAVVFTARLNKLLRALLHTTPGKFENAIINGQFEFLSEENSCREITAIVLESSVSVSKCFPAVHPQTLSRRFLSKSSLRLKD